MNIYVCFNDSSSDPTYTGANDAYLVESEFDSYINDGNPCANNNAKNYIPVMPSTAEDIINFAKIMGWDISTDRNGTIALNTKVEKD